MPKLAYYFPHGRRSSNSSASEGGIVATWPTELAKLSSVVRTTLWLDGMHIRGQVASGALRAKQSLQEAVIALALAHGKTPPEVGMEAVPATSAPDWHQSEPPHRCDAVYQCHYADRGGIVSTPPHVNALRPGTLGGPAPVSGTWQQPLSSQERVRQQPPYATNHQSALVMAREPYRAPPGAGFFGTVGGPAPVPGTWQQCFPNQQQMRPQREPTEQPQYAAHQQSPLTTPRGTYEGPPVAGFAGTATGPAPVFGRMRQLDPRQGQMPPPQGVVRQLHVVHQRPLMVARGPCRGVPYAGYAGTEGKPAPLFGMTHQSHPRQERVPPPQGAVHQPPVVQRQPPGMTPSSYQGPAGAGYAGTAGDPDTFFCVMHLLDPRQAQVRPGWDPVQQLDVVQQPLIVARGVYPGPPGSGWDWGAKGQVPGPRASEPDEISRGAQAYWAERR